MEEHLNPLALTHLLQHTLRSLCSQEDFQWVYAVFWRILPRNYPPPKWDLQVGAYDRTRANRRNWILAWEDGFCNFAASSCEAGGGQLGLQPELFFKMSHDIYNYGEGLVGKVAADHSHKWVFKELQDHDQETGNSTISWTNLADSHPRTWEAQFQSGVQTIALVAVREGVVQLGAMKKVVEDLSFVLQLRRKFGYLESIPGVLLPHPSSSAFPAGCPVVSPDVGLVGPVVDAGAYDVYVPPPTPPLHVIPSMSSLEALLSKLPSVCPAATEQQGGTTVLNGLVPMIAAAKEELVEDDGIGHLAVGDPAASGSTPYYTSAVAKPHEF